MKKILFIQLPPPRFDFCESPLNIPLAAGFMMSAILYGSNRADSAIREMDTAILDHWNADILGDQGLIRSIEILQPDILCITLYVWNVQRSLFIASMVKRNFPGVRNVVGGPEVTPDNHWVLRHPAVDVGIFGEGESRILPVLEALVEKAGLNKIPGIFFKKDGALVLNRRKPELWNLDSCPYPYLNGSPNIQHYQTAFVETARGCPFKCRYCFYHKSYDRVRFHSEDRLSGLFEFLYSKSCDVSEIYLMDPTFNARPDYRNILALLASLRKKKDIRLHTELRSDLLTDSDISLFNDAGLVSAEIGLQSADTEVLKKAGRTGNPQLTMSGARKLKDSGIEVTTGIILGLPGDTPQGFSRTLRELKGSGAYSVIHPFTLSALPGTNFRAHARDLGLQYHDRPPYHVYQTPTFPKEAFRDSLLEFEAEFETELDHINPPSLVCDSRSFVSRPEHEPYISKWIIDESISVAPGLIQLVANKSSDPFCFWFRWELSRRGNNRALDVLRPFCDANPYTGLHIILEDRNPPQTELIREIIEATAQPDLYLNRYYNPLYRDNEVISPCVWIIIPLPSTIESRNSLLDAYSSYGKIIWKVNRFDIYSLHDSWSPLLVSMRNKRYPTTVNRVFDALMDAHAGCLDEIFFEEAIYQELWDKTVRGLKVKNRISEKILAS